MHRERVGFTLIELLVALAIGATVLAGARSLLDGLADETSAVAHAGRDADARANAEWTARQVVGNLTVADGLRPDLVGNSTEATFKSWCPSARGGLAPCQVRLAVQPIAGSASSSVILELSTGDRVLLRRGARAWLSYLNDASSGGRWVPQWGTVGSVPLAISVTTDSSTLLFRIGERR